MSFGLIAYLKKKKFYYVNVQGFLLILMENCFHHLLLFFFLYKNHLRIKDTLMIFNDFAVMCFFN